MTLDAALIFFPRSLMAGENLGQTGKELFVLLSVPHMAPGVSRTDGYIRPLAKIRISK